MSKQFRKTIEANPNLMLTIAFFLMTVVNAVVIAGANFLLPEHVVLGTISISYPSAVVLSATTLAVFTILAMPLVKQFEIQQKRDLKPYELMGIYLVLNFLFVWLIARVSDLLGLGISSWVIAVLLAAVLDFFQGAVMMQVEKMRTK